MGTIQERTSKDGNKSYLVRIRKKGQKLVCKTFKRKTDASKYMRDVECDMDRSVFNYYEANKHTLGELIERYNTQYYNSSNKYHRNCKRMLDWWNNKLGMLYLSAVTPAVVSEYIQILKNEEITKGHKKTKRTPGTVNRYISALSVVFSSAYREYQWIAENPMKKCSKLKEAKGRTNMLQECEIKELLKHCKQNPSPYIYTIVLIALTTGARLDEIMSLKWRYVDLEKQTLTYTQTKNGDIRTVKLHQKLVPLLTELRDNPPIATSEYIFPRKDGKAPIIIRKRWNEVVKQAGIENFRFHDLRHTAASYLAMNGANLLDIAEILGHKTLSMVKRYSHLSMKHSFDVQTSMNDKLFASIKIN